MFISINKTTKMGFWNRQGKHSLLFLNIEGAHFLPSSSEKSPTWLLSELEHVFFLIVFTSNIQPVVWPVLVSPPMLV